METQNYFIIIAGPTGVGKTEFADRLLKQLKKPAEIINADLGQFYTPLNIGTAKPDNIENQHLFNIINEPKNFTVHDYREALIERLNKLWSAGILPIIVGGSGFYIKSIFYPPIEYAIEYTKEEQVNNRNNFSKLTTEELLTQLMSIDSERASTIDKNDRYRIERALAIWQKTGQKPSTLKPKFKPLGICSFYYLNRERDDLYKKINFRVGQMFNKGWLEEVKQLDNKWYTFLKEKKIIGYSEIIDYIENKHEESKTKLEELIQKISQRSRSYAKRQLTFWQSMRKLILEDIKDKRYIKEIKEINLTNTNIKKN